LPASEGIIAELPDQVIVNPTYSLHPDRSPGIDLVRRIEYLHHCRRISKCLDLLASNAAGRYGLRPHWRPCSPKSGDVHDAVHLSTMTGASTSGGSSPGVRPGWESLPPASSGEAMIGAKASVEGSAFPEIALRH
jgi:hypothetical protein